MVERDGVSEVGQNESLVSVSQKSHARSAQHIE